jgi:hypothetical protein
MQIERAWRTAWLPFWLAAAIVPFLAAGLPADGFFVGDAGVKLVAAMNVRAHPLEPLQVTPPVVGDRPAPALMDPFFAPHGEHAHAMTPPLFPLLTAPLLGLFGLRGLYVIPIASYLLLIPATAALARAAGSRRPAAAGAAIAFGSPLLFYGLEYWEHAPAVLCAVWAAALVLDALPRPEPRLPRREPWPEGSRPYLLSGVATAVAFQLRPELVWSGVALLAVLLMARTPPRYAVAWATAAAAGLLPLAAYNTIHFDNPLGPHLTTNLQPLAGSWLTSRAQVAGLWFLTVGRESVWRAFPLAIAGLTVLRRDAGGRALWTLVVVPLVGVLVTAPNDGGGQWGPRYLLGIVPPMAVLAVDAMDDWLQRARARAAAARAATVAAVFALVAISIMATREGYIELRITKRLHAEISGAIAALDERYVLTDLWWLDQLAAPAADRHVFLYADSAEALGGAATLLRDAGVEAFALVRTRSDERGAVEAVERHGYVRTGVSYVAVRDLEIIEYRGY